MAVKTTKIRTPTKKATTKTIKKVAPWPEWIKESLEVLKPPENLKVSQWAEKYRILDEKTAAIPGTWKNTVTPYLEEIMDSFNDPEVEEIIFCKCTQIGGTEAANNIIGYIVAQDPSPTLVVYPTVELADYTSKNRLQPMIKLSPATRDKFAENDSKLLELQFDGMYLALSGSNSPSALASRPIRYLILDEVDKYDKFSGGEADPISLGKERQKTFSGNKKTFITSTPTTKNGNIWRAMEAASELRRFYVPCPHCGSYQTFRWKQIKYPKEVRDPEEVSELAYYQCESCEGIITDQHKSVMLKNGKWIAEKKGKNKRTVAFHINAIYSPWVRFGDVAREFVKSHQYPELLMNFVNSWLGEPWEETTARLESDKVLSRMTEVDEMVVPEWTYILTAGIDVQKNCFYYTIRAWGEFMTSQNITHGVVYSWADVELVMNSKFTSENGKEFQVSLAAIDSGNDTEEVYNFCSYNQEWAIPVKGSSREMHNSYSMSYIDKAGSKGFGLRLVIVNTKYYKNMIASRLNRPTGKGSWMVYRDCDIEYAEQVSSEEKVIEKGKEVWKPKVAHADNHFLDTEVYASVAADIMQIRYYRAGEEIQEIREPDKKLEENSFIKNDNWINKNGNWLK